MFQIRWGRTSRILYYIISPINVSFYFLYAQKTGGIFVEDFQLTN
nr:MAG TPA: hypothetical protein [Caudoviricetes sp.]